VIPLLTFKILNASITEEVDWVIADIPIFEESPNFTGQGTG